MNSEQKALFFKILRDSMNSGNYITVKKMARILKTDEANITKPWHSKFKVSLALEHNYKWTLYAREIDKDKNI